MESVDRSLLKQEVQQRAALSRAIGDLDREAHDLAVLMGNAARLLSVRPPEMTATAYRDQAKEGNRVLANEVTSRAQTGTVETRRLTQLALVQLARVTETVALRASNGETIRTHEGTTGGGSVQKVKCNSAPMVQGSSDKTSVQTVESTPPHTANCTVDDGAATYLTRELAAAVRRHRIGACQGGERLREDIGESPPQAVERANTTEAHSIRNPPADARPDQTHRGGGSPPEFRTGGGYQYESCKNDNREKSCESGKLGKHLKQVAHAETVASPPMARRTEGGRSGSQTVECTSPPEVGDPRGILAVREAQETAGGGSVHTVKCNTAPTIQEAEGGRPGSQTL